LVYGKLRFRRDYIHKALEPLEYQLSRDARSATTMVLVIVALILGFMVLLWSLVEFDEDTAEMFLGASVLGLFFAGGAIFSAVGKHGRKSKKLVFLRELLEELRPELHPRKMVRVRFDLRHYDHKDPIWTGTSTHGNPKAKYSDKWLQVRAVLADRSQVEIVRQAGLKTKKGSLVKEKRRLTLTITPPHDSREIFEKGKKTLGTELNNSLHAYFHDRPEAFKVASRKRAGALKIKAMQLDAPFLAQEVTSLLRAVYGHFYA